MVEVEGYYGTTFAAEQPIAPAYSPSAMGEIPTGLGVGIAVVGSLAGAYGAFRWSKGKGDDRLIYTVAGLFGGYVVGSLLAVTLDKEV